MYIYITIYREIRKPHEYQQPTRHGGNLIISWILLPSQIESRRSVNTSAFRKKIDSKIPWENFFSLSSLSFRISDHSHFFRINRSILHQTEPCQIQPTFRRATASLLASFGHPLVPGQAGQLSVFDRAGILLCDGKKGIQCLHIYVYIYIFIHTQ